ncbi:MAG: acyl-phosphate glycerol 3-phosphate acyltransferase [Proteobacteria bacterium]|nr:acyl-phosphate glycerol 3-phosphate acyltransferase [Pseudomonadota bacterium]
MIFLALILSSLLASIPFGVIFALYFSNKDPRKHGSFNIGMTNAWRVCGWEVGMLTLMGDLGKGALLITIFQPHLTESTLSLLAFSAVFFHCYSIYLNFEGGKGLATASGVLLVIEPFWFLILFISWLLIRLVTKSSSIAAFSAIALMLFLCCSILSENQMGFFAIATLIAWRHQENLERLMTHSELGP